MDSGNRATTAKTCCGTFKMVHITRCAISALMMPQDKFSCAASCVRPWLRLESKCIRRFVSEWRRPCSSVCALDNTRIPLVALMQCILGAWQNRHWRLPSRPVDDMFFAFACARRTLDNAVEMWSGSETRLQRERFSSKNWYKGPRSAEAYLCEEMRILQAGDERRNSCSSQSNGCLDTTIFQQLFAMGTEQAQQQIAFGKRTENLETQRQPSHLGPPPPGGRESEVSSWFCF